MKRANIRVKISGIISEQMGLRGEEIKDDSLLADLGVDSLDFVEMIMDVEDDFEIEISDEDAEKITTLGQAVQCVARHLEAKEAQEK